MELEAAVDVSLILDDGNTVAGAGTTTSQVASADADFDFGAEFARFPSVSVTVNIRSLVTAGGETYEAKIEQATDTGFGTITNTDENLVLVVGSNVFVINVRDRAWRLRYTLTGAGSSMVVEQAFIGSYSQ